MYRPFVEVSVKHEYFSGRCYSFEFAPTEDALEVFRHENVEVKSSKGSLLVFADEESFAEPVKLPFLVYTKDSALWNVTCFESFLAGEIPTAVILENSVVFENRKLELFGKNVDCPRPMFGMELRLNRTVPFFRAEIPLATRRLRWRYCINRNSAQYNLEIRNVRGEVASFDMECASNDSFYFTSREKIPLVYGAPPRFQLRDSKNAGMLLKAMPNMDANSLAKISSNGCDEMVAERFINL